MTKSRMRRRGGRRI